MHVLVLVVKYDVVLLIRVIFIVVILIVIFSVIMACLLIINQSWVRWPSSSLSIKMWWSLLVTITAFFFLFLTVTIISIAIILLLDRILIYLLMLILYLFLINLFLILLAINFMVTLWIFCRHIANNFTVFGWCLLLIWSCRRRMSSFLFNVFWSSIFIHISTTFLGWIIVRLLIVFVIDRFFLSRLDILIFW